MRKLERLLHAGLVVGILMGAGCAAGNGQRRAELGARSSPVSPPSASVCFFEDKPGHVWVHGRWARQEGQWVWQPGYHEPARPGMVWMNGFWDRQDGTFVWVDGKWAPAREGQVFVPGHLDQRGTANVWIRDRWEPVREGEVWVPGAWTVEDGEQRWTDGRWETRQARR